MSDVVKDAERRQFGRRAAYLHGWIRLQGRPAITCVLRNISQGGALLTFDHEPALPFEFLLEIDGWDLTVGCEVRHHFGRRVGVAFIDTALVHENASSNHSEKASWITSKIAAR